MGLNSYEMEPKQAQLQDALRHAFTGKGSTPDDKAKYAVAQALLNRVWTEGEDYMFMAEAGGPVKAALGDSFGTSKQRAAQGKPTLTAILKDTAIFSLSPDHTTVRLNMAAVESLLHEDDLASSDQHGRSKEALPIRPGAIDCKFYMKTGWCGFGAKCPYNHPLERQQTAAAGKPAKPALAHLDCAHWIVLGVCNHGDRCSFKHSPALRGPGSMGPPESFNSRGLPVRPNIQVCPHLTHGGHCKHGPRCWFNHPEGKEVQQRPIKMARGPTNAAGELLQPDASLLLDWLVDGLWPPEGGPQLYLRGALAKHLISCCFDVDTVGDPEAAYYLNGGPAGSYLSQHWKQQARYPLNPKPYSSLRDLVIGDNYLFVASVNSHATTDPGLAPDTAQVGLAFGKLLQEGPAAAVARLRRQAAHVWQPKTGQRRWLCHQMAGRLLEQGLEGGAVVAQLKMLAEEEVPAEQRTTFRLDAAVAAQLLRARWLAGKHPYPVDPTQVPWGSFKTLFDEDPYLSLERAAHSAFAVLDVVGLAEAAAGLSLRDGPQGASAAGGNAQAARKADKHAPSSQAATDQLSCFGLEVDSDDYLEVIQDSSSDDEAVVANKQQQKEDLELLLQRMTWQEEVPASTPEPLQPQQQAPPQPLPQQQVVAPAIAPVVAPVQPVAAPPQPLPQQQVVGPAIAPVVAPVQPVAAPPQPLPQQQVVAPVPAVQPVQPIVTPPPKLPQVLPPSQVAPYQGQPDVGPAPAAVGGYGAAGYTSGGSGGGGGGAGSSWAMGGAGGGGGGGASWAMGAGGGSGGGAGGVGGAGGDDGGDDTGRRGAPAGGALREIPPELAYRPPAVDAWRNPNGVPSGWKIIEAAVKMIDPMSDPASLAELMQHLEIVNVLAIAAPTYKVELHLLQLFLPAARAGGLVLPATVYIIDVMRADQMRQVMPVLKPALESSNVLKVCHSSKNWSYQVCTEYHVDLKCYYDTQQGNYILKCLQAEAGRIPATDINLSRTQEVSLSSLLQSYNFYHPVRHLKQEVSKLWQNRPLPDVLVRCASADVLYLIPLMEAQVAHIWTAASPVLNSVEAGRLRGPGSPGSVLPFDREVLVALARKGVSGTASPGVRGCLAWAQLGTTFQQQPLQEVVERTDMRIAGIGRYAHY